MPLSRAETAAKLSGRQLDIAQDTSERPNFERTVTVQGNRRAPFPSGKKVMTAAYTKQRESLALQEADHFLASHAGQLSHWPDPQDQSRGCAAMAAKLDSARH